MKLKDIGNIDTDDIIKKTEEFFESESYQKFKEDSDKDFIWACVIFLIFIVGVVIKILFF